MNIVVLAGGLSPERNVSLSSGSLITAALRRKGHNVIMIDVYEGISPLPDDPSDLFFSAPPERLAVGSCAPSPEELEEIRRRNGGRAELIGPGVIEMCRLAQITFLALHGDIGENGQLQATLDLFGIKYTGSGYIGSLLAMNKDIAKKIMRQSGINTPDWFAFCPSDDLDDVVRRAEGSLGFPCIVKPCSCGSSVGVFMASSSRELKAAISAAAAYEASLIVEKCIIGREFTQGIIDRGVLPPVEIIPKQGFYDYANKYVANATEEICPANISQGVLEDMSDMTARCFDALRLRDYARFDYIMDENGRIWCLEANTLPGMTPTSLLPQEAKAVGIEYDELCERLASLAQKR